MSPEIPSTNRTMLERMLGSGWEVKEGDPSLLVRVVRGGLVHCVDGRKVDQFLVPQKIVRGPKIQGGAEGVALLLAKAQGVSEVDESWFRKACQVIKNSGFVPGVHDFDHLHCGHFNLASQGKFEGMPRFTITAGDMSRIVGEFGWSQVHLAGQHEEYVMRVNWDPNMTLIPNKEAFNLDAWYANVIGINQETLLDNAAKTVMGLSSVRTVEVFG